MSVALLSYADLGARLNISREAARALARRHRLPRSRSEDGKALVSVDVSELRYKPRPRIGRQVGRQADHIAASMAEIEALKTAALEIEAFKAEIARLETAAADTRADFERERERADRLAVELKQAAAETIAANERAAAASVAEIQASEIEAFKAEIARLEIAAADTRADFERERERADRLAVELKQAAAETTAANEWAAQLEEEVTALRTGRAGGSDAGQAARRLGRLAASIIGADRAASTR
ncbi:hypothetical protein [Bradyrhizobium sp.]|uniref:hypothetical protein n=1 Tax=Bradyrhizobium sp. TaxID=376 RepID=UPI002DDC939A|nr:hypothetical protein [Bradyrhizobium sp.]HEV2158307.1 hypothetical protein [Bradyrhizobium sp.]